MSVDELYKQGYTIIPNLIGHETCDTAYFFLNFYLEYFHN